MKNSRTMTAMALTLLFTVVTVVVFLTSGEAGWSFVTVPAALAVIGAGTTLVLMAVDQRLAAAERTEMHTRAEQNLYEREQAWKHTVRSLEERIQELQGQTDAATEVRTSLSEAIGLLRETQPIIVGLAKKAIEKSEHGSTSLTEDIYEIGKQSTSLSESITGFLTEMSVGEESLEHNIDELTTDMHRLTQVAGLCDEANSSLDHSIDRISNSVAQTTELLGQVSEIAEQTSILAINAAIYAAKAGDFGQGFSVIASEIQKLSGTSKEVAETINTNTQMIERQVAEFSSTHRSLMNESQTSLHETIESVRTTIEVLKPKAERITSSIQDAAGVSEAVTARLNEVNMAMQEQDAIQQIVSHIAEILQEALERAPQDVVRETLGSRTDAVRELARSLAVRHFTMQDEYLAVGHDGYRTGERRAEMLEDGSELAGDVTLF